MRQTLERMRNATNILTPTLPNVALKITVRFLMPHHVMCIQECVQHFSKTNSHTQYKRVYTGRNSSLCCLYSCSIHWSHNFVFVYSLSNAEFFGNVSCQAKLQSIMPWKLGSGYGELPPKILHCNHMYQRALEV